MKKIVIFIAIAMYSLVSVNAQEVLNKGDKAFNLGLGIPYIGGIIPSINFSGEVGVIPTGDIGIVSFGGEAEYKLSVWKSYSYYDNSDKIYTYHQLGFGGRAAWHLHFFNNPKYDLYAGVGIGVHIYNTYDNYDINKQEYIASPHIYPYAQEFVGARIMMSESFGFFGEIGYGNISFMKLGVTFKM